MRKPGLWPIYDVLFSPLFLGRFSQAEGCQLEFAEKKNSGRLALSRSAAVTVVPFLKSASFCNCPTNASTSYSGPQWGTDANCIGRRAQIARQEATQGCGFVPGFRLGFSMTSKSLSFVALCLVDLFPPQILGTPPSPDGGNKRSISHPALTHILTQNRKGTNGISGENRGKKSPKVV